MATNLWGYTVAVGGSVASLNGMPTAMMLHFGKIQAVARRVRAGGHD